jgi:hypothetical protein
MVIVSFSVWADALPGTPFLSFDPEAVRHASLVLTDNLIRAGMNGRIG